MQENGVADGPKPSEADKPTEQDPDDLSGNTKLWLGKDYSNFINKDWEHLDRPFEGMLSAHLGQYRTQREGGSVRPDERKAVYDFQITSTGLKCLACRGGICPRLFTAALPGTSPATSSSAGTSPRSGSSECSAL